MTGIFRNGWFAMVAVGNARWLDQLLTSMRAVHVNYGAVNDNGVKP